MAERNFKRPQYSDTRRRLLADFHDENVSYKVYDDFDAAEMFVDGIASMGIGPGVTKLRFFRTMFSELKGGKLYEEREVVFSMVIPTVTLSEFLLNLPASLKNNINIIEAGSNHGMNLVKKLAGE